VLYAAGEMEEPVRAAVEAHARLCPDCAAALRREMQLAETLAAGSQTAAEPDASDLLLARCRRELSKALDDAGARRSGWREWLRPRNWAAGFRPSLDFHPAWSVAALLLIGLLSGLAGWEGIGRAPLQQLGPTMMTVSAAPPPPVSPAGADAAPQAAAQDRPASDGAGDNVHVANYDAVAQIPAQRPPAPFPVETGAAQDQAPRQAARIPRRGERAPRAWRNAPPPRMPAGAGPAGAWDIPVRGRLAELSRRMESLWWGGVRVDPTEQQKRLVQSPPPEYPEAARRAGIEGQVTLLVRISSDGSVQDATLLSGEPVLGRAASAAVEQWRYAPVRIGGQPANILTSVTFAFELR